MNTKVEQQPSALDRGKNEELQTKEQIKAKSGSLKNDSKDEKGSKHHRHHHRHKPNLLKQIIHKVTHKKEDKGEKIRSVEEPIHQRKIAEPPPAVPKRPEEEAEKFEEGMKPSERLEKIESKTFESDKEFNKTPRKAESEDLTESEETEKRFGRISERSESGKRFIDMQMSDSIPPVERPPEEVKRHFSKVLEEVTTSDAKDSLRNVNESYKPPAEMKQQFDEVINEVARSDSKEILRATEVPQRKRFFEEERPTEDTRVQFQQVLQDITSSDAKENLRDVSVRPTPNVFVHEDKPSKELKEHFDLVLEHATSVDAKQMLSKVILPAEDNWHDLKAEEFTTINLDGPKKPEAITPDPRHLEAAFEEGLEPAQPPPGDVSAWKEKAAAAFLNISATVKETFGYDATEEHLKAKEHTLTAELQDVRNKGTLNAIEAAALAKEKKLDTQPVAHPFVEPMVKPEMIGAVKITGPISKQRMPAH